MRQLLIALCLLVFLNLCMGNACWPQLPKLSSGRLERLEMFRSKYGATHNVDIWLPGDYTIAKKYPVIYMQDGQMLFDSSITWNKMEWQVDETLGRLIKEKKIRECILVGIWNNGEARHAEYFPQKPFELLPKVVKDSLYQSNRQNGASVFNNHKVQSDAYLRFIVNELKPYVDAKYSTLRNKANTFIGGSSMGALISLYAICEYPNIFGGAFCMSTHWTGIFTLENNPVPPVFFEYLKQHLPSPKGHRIYFDHGDKTLDSWYAPFQRQADIIMAQKGFTKGSNWVSLSFPGEDHSERAWARRFALPIEFLLGR